MNQEKITFLVLIILWAYAPKTLAMQENFYTNIQENMAKLYHTDGVGKITVGSILAVANIVDLYCCWRSPEYLKKQLEKPTLPLLRMSSEIMAYYLIKKGYSQLSKKHENSI